MASQISAIQMCSTHDVTANLQQAKKYIQQAAASGSEFMVLPENFALMGEDPKDKLKYKENFGSGVIQDFLRAMAIQEKCWIVGGTIPLIAENKDKVYASSLVFNPHGDCVARYDKMHLFDIELHAHAEIHQESQTIDPGHEVVVFDSPFGKCGIAVCYDIRFPELFRAMQQLEAEMIVVPAAFTVPTGKAHWEVLLRARAIENQVYMVAAAQTGMNNLNRKTYGHSMIVNPWGEVKALLETDPGVVSEEVDITLLQQLRKDFPVLRHRRM